MSGYVYFDVKVATGATFHHVGFFNPGGVWNLESVQPTKGGAADRVHWLNGGNSQQFQYLLETIADQLTRLITEQDSKSKQERQG